MEYLFVQSLMGNLFRNLEAISGSTAAVPLASCMALASGCSTASSAKASMSKSTRKEIRLERNGILNGVSTLEQESMSCVSSGHPNPSGKTLPGDSVLLSNTCGSQGSSWVALEPRIKPLGISTSELF